MHRAPSDAPRTLAIEVPSIVPPPPPQPTSVEEDDFMGEYLWHVNQYINEHVRFSDTKAGSVIVLSGAVLSLMYSGGFHHDFTRAFGQWTPVSVASLATFLLLGASVLTAAWSMRPRLVRNFGTGFVFWEQILGHGSQEAFVAALNARSRRELLDHLAAQIFSVSGVCSRKFYWVARSIQLCISGAMLAAVVMLMR